MSRPSLDRGHSQAEPARGRYGYRYMLAGEPGELLVQCVEVELRYLCAGELLVAYRSRYAEFFRLGSEPSTDIHDFDPRRDGWTRRSVGWLLHHHLGRPRWRARAGPTRLEYAKRFTLGPGSIEGVDSSPPPAFGLLEAGPAGVTETRIELARGPGLEPMVLRPRPHPSGRRHHGQGWFSGEQGWRACETLVHEFEARAGSFDDGGGYEPASLVVGPEHPAPAGPTTGCYAGVGCAR